LANSPRYDIRTSAVYSGNITLTFNVPNVADALTCSKLRSLHYESGAWTTNTNAIPAYNPGTQVCTVSQTVTSLSPFVVALSSAPTHVIRGKLTNGGTALSGVSLALSGSITGTTTTDSLGNYSFSVSGGGNYTVTPSLNNYTFTPPTSTFNNVTSDQTANFAAASSCTYTLSSTSYPAPADGISSGFTVNTQTGCGWTASTTTSSWITVTSATTGSGPGTVTFSVAANTSAARSGTIIAGGQTFTVNQAAASTLPPSTAGLQYYPLAYPIRLLDTRSGQPACYAPGEGFTGYETIKTQPAQVTCQGLTIPSNASAIVGTATALNTPQGGNLRLYPAGEQLAEVSNVNFVPGRTVSNSFTVKLGTGGAFNIYSYSPSDVIIDVTGYYAAPGTGGLYYHQLPNPIRILETRPGEAGYQTPGAPLAANSVRLQQAGNISYLGVTIPAAARAITGNATVVNNGFASMDPSDCIREISIK
jgi:hypothetical protein